MSLISEQMRAAVGGIVDWRVSFPVAASDIRRWAIAVYHPEPPPRRFLDDGPGLIAPEELNPFAWAVADQMTPAVAPGLRDTDKPEKALGIIGPGLTHQLNGGSEVTYGAPIRSGDVIRAETRLHAYRERAGRMGPMLITVFEVEWTNQDGARVKLGHDTSIRY
ncbi:MaoC family dehydratase N-terminal domain-containing protein [Nocardioides sp. NPDC101246]|uniref:FAS1-like dehydratase domain-containing protein n=1 Tax=Nocardioides sp. NPDC101246 TaxID=3364336 RepID=UPI0037F7BA64